MGEIRDRLPSCDSRCVMRRAVFLGLGLFELAAAGLLVFLGLLLPAGSDVERGFDRAGSLTRETVTQVGYLRDQLASVNTNAGLKEARDGLDSVAEGMEAWARALEPETITRLRQGT